MNAAPSTPGREELIAAYALPDRSARRLRMNFVASLDGAATLEGRSGGLGDASDRLAMQVLRTLADVVLVGAGTVRVEGYGGVAVSEADAAWRAAHGLAEQPRLAVVSSSLALDPESAFFTAAVTRPIVVTHAQAPAAQRAALEPVADVIVVGEQAVDVRAMLDVLAERGFRQVLSEGGPHLFGSLLEADLVDELCLSLSPMLVAGDAGRIVRGAPELERRMRLVHAIPAGDLLLLRYARG
ncbi:riboflavin biosynthesis pyrimidine reductase [Agromyces hippuratus]|uniref:Riboflavin biosynthesis pyrimidine reductase n=1 Tax=Agromyces hippuratus TaxID=286438 RepID=A0A852X9M2_9MICO|nr:pyrimidine reductase family protein [Agromyces hippuratus]NYG22611.1 riboflavin biosynthesis pyrimidine reductase [Agromyces hippuratus]